MTNHWNDIGNSTLVVVMGANPAENHPACMAHINNARKGPHTWADPSGATYTTDKTAAKLIVIDPRYTRTASTADVFVRIRPGTDIAFINGVINYIMANVTGQTAINYGTYHNNATATSYLADNEASNGTASTTAFGKYTDSRILVRSDNADYQRGTKYSGGKRLSNFPKYAASYMDADTVYSRLEAHVAPYTLPVAADICGCDQAEIELVAQAFMENCRLAQVASTVTETITLRTATGASASAGQLSGSFLSASSDVGGTHAGTITINNTTGGITSSLDEAGTTVIVTWTGIANDPKHADYRATTMLYAMGLTQHTNGSQNVKSFANLQTLLGNMGRPGGGINALRGIHNVQGSTDMGVLYHLIPGYSGPPSEGQVFSDYVNKLYTQKRGIVKYYAYGTVDCTAAHSDLIYHAVAEGTGGNSISVTYVNAGASQTLSVGVIGSAITVNLATDSGSVVTSTAAQVMAAVQASTAASALVTVGNAASNDGTGLVNAATVTLAGGAATSTANAYAAGTLSHQAQGFFNMHAAWFMPSTLTGQTNIDGTFLLWPRERGDDHITMFRKMDLTDATRIAAAVVWGQNPAVTEPNQGAIRAGLENLDTLVVVDNFATETAMCDRKGTGVTYLIPACSYVEEAGSVTNSGRMLQWREKAATPKGNSKADLELLLRFAKALNDNVTGGSGFKHIADKWTSLGSTVDVWTYLYGVRYACDWTGGADFETTATLTGEVWKAKDSTPLAGQTLLGSEAVAEKICREVISDTAAGGTVWLYSFGYSTTRTTQGGGYLVDNRAKSRGNVDADPSSYNYGGGHRMFKNWGYAWLFNRRVLYQNGDAPWDQADGFQGPDNVARLFVSTEPGLIDYGRAYRTIHTMADWPDTDVSFKATLTVTCGATSLPFTAKAAGQGGNLLSVAYVDPGAASQALSVKCVGTAITVNLATDAGSAITSTQADIKAAVEASTAAKLLVTVGAVTGSGAVTAQAKAFLATSGSVSAPHVAPGRFPVHNEPYETLRNSGSGSANLAVYWGRNTKGTKKWDLVKDDTPLYSPDDISGSRSGTRPADITAAAVLVPEVATPLVLTTIRCVEHFQGGPITRNNTYNVEAEPAPWVEISSTDARARGISDGDWVNIYTLRGDSKASQVLLMPNDTYTRDAGNPADNFGLGFKARVGVGLSGNQRVAQGVVAIPWHWGDQGLSTGARANDLCIDAGDANTVIPEYKACVCWIKKA